MSLKAAKFIKFTIGLITPWWITSIIYKNLSKEVNEYQARVPWYIKYTIGLLMPWWALSIFSILEKYNMYFANLKPNYYYVGAAIIILVILFFNLFNSSGDRKISEPPEITEEIQDTIRFNNILFEYNSSKIQNIYQEDLEIAYKILKNNPNLKILIVGHASQDQDYNESTRIYNINLSKSRAEAVKEWLIKKGIDESRIETDGRGFDEPIASNKTEDGRRKNRRIEFIKK